MFGRRVAELERQMRVDYEALPPVVQDLKQEVTRFRAKLEKTEHLGWMGKSHVSYAFSADFLDDETRILRTQQERYFLLITLILGQSMIMLKRKTMVLRRFRF